MTCSHYGGQCLARRVDFLGCIHIVFGPVWKFKGRFFKHLREQERGLFLSTTTGFVWKWYSQNDYQTVSHAPTHCKPSRQQPLWNVVVPGDRSLTPGSPYSWLVVPIQGQLCRNRQTLVLLGYTCLSEFVVCGFFSPLQFSTLENYTFCSTRFPLWAPYLSSLPWTQSSAKVQKMPQKRYYSSIKFQLNRYDSC